MEKKTRFMKRQFWVLFHRYVGLTTAFFLAIANLTGACLAFYKSLDRWLAPQMYNSPAPGPVLDPFVLLEKVQAQLPGRHTDVIRFSPREGQAVLFYFEPSLDPATGKPDATEHDEYAFDPVSGALLVRFWVHSDLNWEIRTAISKLPYP